MHHACAEMGREVAALRHHLAHPNAASLGAGRRQEAWEFLESAGSTLCQLEASWGRLQAVEGGSGLGLGLGGDSRP